MNSRLLGWMSVPVFAFGLYLSTVAPVYADTPGTPTAATPANATAAPTYERTVRGQLVIEGVPAIPASLSDRMLQYLSNRSASVCCWDPNGNGIIICTRFGETTQLHRVARPGAYREQLTFFPEPVSSAFVNPDAKKHSMLFLKDVGGNENYQIFHFDFDSGSYKMLSNGKARYGSPTWANSGERFAFESTQRNGTDWDIWVADPLNPSTAKMVFSDHGHWSVGGWSQDDSKILLLNYISITNSRLAVLDVNSGAVQYIGLGAATGKGTYAPVSISAAALSGDGKGVFYASDNGSEFHHLYYQRLDQDRPINLTPDIPWDIESVTVSKDGKHVAFVSNEDGVNKTYLLDTAKISRHGSVAYSPVRGLPQGVVTGCSFDPRGARLAVSLSCSQTPGDVFVTDINRGSLTRWTFSEVGGLNTDNFVDPTLIHFDTFDKVNGQPRQIPAFYYKPKQATGPMPVLIEIHGGPESQMQPYFSSLTQYLVNELGIAVIKPNVRGSSGYGKTYVSLDNGFLREDSVKDIGSLLDWIASQPELDKNRVAVMGGSYGGYMTLASMEHYNDRLTAGVDNVGISNFITFLKNTQDYRRDLRRAEYGDERDPEMHAFMEKIAPTNNAHKLTKPMFVIQGKNDPRVPVTEAEQMVREIRGNGGDVWYLMAEDEGHGFRKKTNRDFYLQAVVMFLQKHLLK